MKNDELKQLGMPDGITFRNGRFEADKLQTNEEGTHEVEPLYPCGVQINEDDPANEDDNILLPTDIELIGQRNYADEDNGVQPLLPPEIQRMIDENKKNIEK